MKIASDSIRPIIIRQIADSLSIFIACYLSNLIFLSNSKITEIVIPTISLFTLLIVVFIPTFYFLGIYTFLRSADSGTKTKKIILASLVSAILLIAVFIVFNNYFQQNFYIFLFFGLLILGDISWLKSNNCFKTLNIAVGFVISSLLGLLWGVFINKSNNKDLQYFTGEGKSCSIPARKTFKCKKRVLG